MRRRLTLAGGIVTLDAMGTPTEIAQTLRTQGTDYILAVKGNQSTLQAAVQDTCALARAAEADRLACHTTVHGGQSRIETRHCRGIGDREILAYVNPHDAWPDLRSLIDVESVRRRGTQRTTQTRHFISRGPPDAPALLTALRGHWREPSGRENSLHWVLDVAFREDACRLRKGHAARHRAVLRRTAHTLLRQNTRTKLGMENKRLKAGRNRACREEILGL